MSSEKKGAKAPSDRGWLNCTQCGWGHAVSRWEVDCGDYLDGSLCNHCGLGPIKIDFNFFSNSGSSGDVMSHRGAR